MATKLGRMVTSLEKLLTIKSHENLITWSCKATYKQKPLYHYYQNDYGHQTWQDGSSH